MHDPVVVFDFGGVVFDWSPLYVYEQLIPDADARAVFLRDVCNNEWNVQQDAGRSLQEATEERVAKFPQYEALIRAYYQRWPEMLKGTLPQGVRLVEALHARGVPLFGLTNWSAETFPYARKHYPFLQMFRDIVVSGEERLIKPDQGLYAVLEQRAGVAPERLIFLDDNRGNVEVARARGWRAIHHDDRAFDRTLDQLAAMGLTGLFPV